MVWIEHRELRSQQPDRADDYMNCLFSCRFCNGRRTTKPVVDEKGRTLLDPRKVAWADRFEWDGIYLIPKSGDADAEYTYEAYRIDDDKRTGRRKWRDKRIPWLLRVFRAAPDRIRQHQHQAELYGRKNQTSRALKALQRAREWQEALEVVTDELRTFSAVPDDAPAHCRCDDPSPFRLPDWLDRQTIEIDL